jgi:heme oxygenase
MTVVEAAQVSNRDRLKRSTKTAHACAEARWFSSGSFASRTAYQHWLSALLHTHSAYGLAAVQSAGLRQYSAIEAKRRTALERDLDVSVQYDGIQQNASLDWSWGVLYALNGSALGASILLKSGSVLADWPTEYLAEMRGFAASGQLKSFFDDLNAEYLDTGEMLKGANAVFNCLASI